MIMSIPQCIILEILDTLSQKHNFDWVFLEIPAETCIEGMLLTRPIQILDHVIAKAQ